MFIMVVPPVIVRPVTLLAVLFSAGLTTAVPVFAELVAVALFVVQVCVVVIDAVAFGTVKLPVVATHSTVVKFSAVAVQFPEEKLEPLIEDVHWPVEALLFPVLAHVGVVGRGALVLPP